MTIVKEIKIYGERNSGTNYLNRLINYNLQIKNLGENYLTKFGWKHGYPTKKPNKTTLFLYIFRDLNDWLFSFFSHPYHLKREKHFPTFLTTNLVPTDRNKYHPVYKELAQKKTIFQLRYSKLNSMIDFFEQVDNMIFIHLSLLQKYPQKVIEKISKAYSIPMKGVFRDHPMHTKTHQVGLQNYPRRRFTEKERSIIEHNKNIKLETKLNSYKNKLVYKRSGKKMEYFL